ncbi:putative non-specific serine/threonine protein kinase [Helianthus anomalus]
MGSAEVPLFSLSKISRATSDFSVDNKLGECRFGPSVLEEGLEIAVKRLSKSSRQGLIYCRFKLRTSSTSLRLEQSFFWLLDLLQVQVYFLSHRSNHVSNKIGFIPHRKIPMSKH